VLGLPAYNLPNRRSGCMASHLWLQNNRRIAAWSLVAPGLVFSAGLVAALLLPGGGAWIWLKVLAWLVTGLGVVLIAVAICQLVRPRIVCDGQRLLIDVGFPGRAAVPLEVVECFLLGQGPAFLPGSHWARAETVTVVIRLAEKAEAWRRGRIHPLIGSWCDGYIVLRGTFCEPLTVDVVNRLNHLLAEAHRKLREEGKMPPAGQANAGRAASPCMPGMPVSPCMPSTSCCAPPPCPPAADAAEQTSADREGAQP